MTIKQLRETAIEKALKKHTTIELAAKALGITSRTLYNYKKKKK